MPKKKDKTKEHEHWEPVSPGGGSWRQKEYNGMWGDYPNKVVATVSDLFIPYIQKHFDLQRECTR